LHTVLLADGAGAAEIASAFIDAIAAHRHLSRDSDPPTK
jgi:catalase